METSFTIFLQWDLMSSGGHEPVTYTITSCPKEGGECIVHPHLDGSKKEGTENCTLFDLNPMETYNVTIIANTSRLILDDGLEIEILYSKPVLYEATTRGE